MTMGGVITIAELCNYLIALDTRNSHLPFEVNTHDVAFKGPAVDGIRLCRIWVLVEHCPQLVEEVGICFRAALVFFCHGLLLSIAALVTPAVVYNATMLASGDESLANFLELHKAEVQLLRISLPRTRVNKAAEQPPPV